MAFKLVVALTCFAFCHSSPIFLNGYIYRNGRSFAVGQASGGDHATGSATINGDVVQAYGSATSDNNQFARNGYQVYPGQLVAQAEAQDNPNSLFGTTKAVAEAQNTPTYYAVPAPGTVVTYEQNYQTPGSIAAESSAVVNGNSETSVSSVRSDGSGLAQSSAQTNGVTSTNANTYGSGSGSASSNANTAFGSTVTSAKTQGFGAASSRSQGETGLTSAQSQSNGGFGSASSTINEAQRSAVVSANSQGLGSASSNANVNNVIADSVISASRTGSQAFQGWRFGTFYDTPSIIGAGSVQANSVATGSGAKSTAQVNEDSYGTIQSVADAQGSGVVNAKADINGGYVHSAADSQNLGYGAFNPLVYNSINSDIGYGSIKSTANSQGSGHAQANAEVNNAGTYKTTANSNGYGSASSTVNSNPTFATFRTYVPYGGARSAVNAQTSGCGTATSSIQGTQNGYRVVNSSANSNGYGSANANAQSY